MWGGGRNRPLTRNVTVESSAQGVGFGVAATVVGRGAGAAAGVVVGAGVVGGVGVSVGVGAGAGTPRAVSVTACGDGLVLLLKRNVAVRGPVLVGAKRTLMWHVVPAGIGAGQSPPAMAKRSASA